MKKGPTGVDADAQLESKRMPLLETSVGQEAEDTLPVDVAIARYLEALAAKRGEEPRIGPAQRTQTERAVEASARMCALSRGHLAADHRGLSALYRMHLQLAAELHRMHLHLACGLER
jgi:hypothetical protein